MLLIKVIFTFSLSSWASCTIAGLNYMDPLNFKPANSPSSEDECNPLYWYPRNIPEYCYFKVDPKPSQKPMPVPVPIPLPSQPFPIPIPMGPTPQIFSLQQPFPMSSSYPMAAPPIPMPTLSMPICQYPPLTVDTLASPLPYGIPIAPINPMLPVAGVPAMPYPSLFPQHRPRYQAGLVPGIPGLVTHDGGINILPFSDAYADLLEKHKQKIIRKKIKRVLDDYDGYSGRRAERRRRQRH